MPAPLAERTLPLRAFLPLIAAFALGCPARNATPCIDCPSPAITVEPVLTLSGTLEIERGECIAFRIRTTDLALADPRVFLGPFEGLPAAVPYEIAPSLFTTTAPDTIDVGAPCLFLGLGLPLGGVSVTLVDGPVTLSAPAFEAIETTRIELGDAPTDSAASTDPDANTLSSPREFDVYKWTVVTGDGFLLTEVRPGPSADAAFAPFQFVSPRNLSPIWLAHELAIVPVHDFDYVTEVFDAARLGGPGFDYQFSVSALAPPAPMSGDESCTSPVATLGSSAVVALDLTGAQSDLDPAGAVTCADRHAPGSGIVAPGPERVFRVTVPAGATLTAAARGETTDAVLYLLPTSCVPDACLAAADTFGPGSTETLVWQNSGPTADVWVVVDDFGGGGSVPALMVLVVRIE